MAKKVKHEKIGDERFSYTEILMKIDQYKHERNSVKIKLTGDLIKINSLRLQTFAKSNVCAKCGLVGNVFAKTINNPNASTWHLNLYADTPDGLVLFTKDHIKPKSDGGKDHIDNMQTMCIRCNTAKGSLPNDLFNDIPTTLALDIQSILDTLDQDYIDLCKPLQQYHNTIVKLDTLIKDTLPKSTITGVINYLDTNIKTRFIRKHAPTYGINTDHFDSIAKLFNTACTPKKRGMFSRIFRKILKKD